MSYKTQPNYLICPKHSGTLLITGLYEMDVSQKSVGNLWYANSKKSS